MIIMTSNIGADILAALPVGEPSSNASNQVMARVRAHFTPEFLNRIDDIILFNSLTRQDMDKIVDIQLQEVQKLLQPKMIRMEVSPLAHKWIADSGYDPAYGARPLRRVIQKTLLNPLAKMILEGSIKEGDQTLLNYDPVANGIVFAKK